MNADQLIHGFDFDNDAFRDQQIGTKSFIVNLSGNSYWNGNLARNLKALALQDIRQHQLIDRFQQTWTNFPMHMISRIDDFG